MDSEFVIVFELICCLFVGVPNCTTFGPKDFQTKYEICPPLRFIYATTECSIDLGIGLGRWPTVTLTKAARQMC